MHRDLGVVDPAPAPTPRAEMIPENNDTQRQVLDRIARAVAELANSVPTTTDVGNIVARLHDCQERCQDAQLSGQVSRLKRDRTGVANLIVKINRDADNISISSAESVQAYKSLVAYQTLLQECLPKAAAIKELHREIQELASQLKTMQTNVAKVQRFPNGDLASIFSGLSLSQLMIPPAATEPTIEVEPDVAMDIDRYLHEAMLLLSNMRTAIDVLPDIQSIEKDIQEPLNAAIELMKTLRDKEKQRLADETARLQEQLQRLKDLQ